MIIDGRMQREKDAISGRQLSKMRDGAAKRHIDPLDNGFGPKSQRANGLSRCPAAQGRYEHLAPAHDFDMVVSNRSVSHPQRLAKPLEQRRMGDPEEIGPLTAYLVSPLSGFVTGSCFVIDGGEVSKL